MQDRSYLNLSPRLIVFTWFSLIFLSFQAFSWIFKWDNIHIGPLDGWTCQIVTLIILKHAKMTILGWNQPIYICNDFPLFFSVFINIHEYANYANKVHCIFDHGMKRPMSWLYFSTNFSALRLKAAEILLILYVYPHSWNTFLMFS